MTFSVIGNNEASLLDNLNPNSFADIQIRSASWCREAGAQDVA